MAAAMTQTKSFLRVILSLQSTETAYSTANWLQESSLYHHDTMCRVEASLSLYLLALLEGWLSSQTLAKDRSAEFSNRIVGFGSVYTEADNVGDFLL